MNTHHMNFPKRYGTLTIDIVYYKHLKNPLLQSDELNKTLSEECSIIFFLDLFLKAETKLLTYFIRLLVLSAIL